MSDLQIADMLADYHKECELAETLREKADVQLKHARLIREALRQPPGSGECEHPYHAVLGDGEMQPAKCLKCGKVL